MVARRTTRCCYITVIKTRAGFCSVSGDNSYNSILFYGSSAFMKMDVGGGGCFIFVKLDDQFLGVFFFFLPHDSYSRGTTHLVSQEKII